MDPESAGEQALALYDADKDGSIAGEELDNCPGLKQGLRQLDGNRDQALSGEEIAARLRQYQEDRLGVVGFIGHVTLDGRPLVGAEVTLVPEEFLGSDHKPAKATTDPGGDFRLKTAGINSIGAQPGIYRIQISKKDASGKESIPARYNSETTLGVELGNGSSVTNSGLELRLSSGDAG
jgi:hypothetical protein